MPHNLKFALRAARTALSHPIEALDRMQIWREGHDPETRLDLPELQPRVDDALHELLGVSGCQTCAGELAAVTEAMSRRLAVSTYHDASTSLAHAVWIATRHGRPTRAVETGVGQGVTTNLILSAMQLNGHGHLTSIDLPPLANEWHGSTAAAVDPAVKDRWTYRRGAVRRELPRVLAMGEPIGLFVHDALHTYASMKFEFTSAWGHLADDAVLVADDVELNAAFVEFAEGKTHLLFEEHSKHSAVGVVRKVAHSYT